MPIDEKAQEKARKEKVRRLFQDCLREKAHGNPEYENWQMSLFNETAASPTGMVECEVFDDDGEMIKFNLTIDDMLKSGYDSITDGITPAIHAIYSGNIENVKKTLSQSMIADLETGEFLSDDNYDNLLQHAVSSKNAEIFDEVLGWVIKQLRNWHLQGLSSEAPDQEKRNWEKFISNQIRDYINISNIDGQTALMLSLSNQDEEISRKLIDKGAWNGIEGQSFIEMVEAAKKVNEEQKATIINQLISHMEDIYLSGAQGDFDSLVEDLKDPKFQKYFNKESAMLVGVALEDDDLIEEKRAEIDESDIEKLKEMLLAKPLIEEKMSEFNPCSKRGLVFVVAAGLLKNTNPDLIDKYPELQENLQTKISEILYEIKGRRPSPRTKVDSFSAGKNGPQNDKSQNR